MMVGVVGSLLFALASSYVTLAVGRALLGIGMAGVMVGGLKALSQWYPTDRFATAMGLLTGFGLLGALLSATPLAWLNDMIGWRAVFAAGAGAIALSALLLVLLTRNAPPGPEGAPAWAHKKRGANHLPRILQSLDFWRIALPVAIMAGAGAAFRGLWAGPYLYDIFQLPALQTGHLLLLLGVGASIGSIFGGWLVDRWGANQVLLLTVTLHPVCLGLLSLQPPLAVTACAYGLLGLSSASVLTLLTQARRLFPETLTGQVLSMLNLLGFGGAFLLQWWIGVVVDRFPSTAAGHYEPQAYTVVLLFLMAISILSFTLYLPRLWPTRRTNTALS
jgi:predicted MFS family arabinose efflux permease